MSLGIFNWPNVNWPNPNLPLVVWYLQWLLTPVIATVVAYIGWQQSKTKKAEVRWANAEAGRMADRFKNYLNLSKL
jgi:hypothetical protein